MIAHLSESQNPRRANARVQSGITAIGYGERPHATCAAVLRSCPPGTPADPSLICAEAREFLLSGLACLLCFLNVICRSASKTLQAALEGFFISILSENVEANSSAHANPSARRDLRRALLLAIGSAFSQHVSEGAGVYHMICADAR